MVLDKIKGNFKGKDILSLDQFDASSISKLFKTTDKIIRYLKSGKSLELLRGRVITLLFFEPSSRTFGSFMSAAQRLGAQAIDVQNPEQSSSRVKGESLEDTIKTFEAYSDLIIIRHPEMGSAKLSAGAAVHIPVINAGDGPADHPTQTLYDLYTIYKRFGKLSGLKVVISGDPLHSRAIKSLAKGLSLYKNNQVIFLSPKELRLTGETVERLRSAGLGVSEIFDEKDIPGDANVWYWNRIQKERFRERHEYEKVIGKFTLTKKLLNKKGNNNMIILDPLPRIEEIATEVDDDPRALYLTLQLKSGLHVRMALLTLVLGAL